MRSIKAFLGVALLSFGLIVPASATILYAGGEDIDGTLFGSASVSTNSSSFRAGYARASIEAVGSSTAIPTNNRFLIPAFSAQSSLWVHAETYLDNQNSNNGYEFIGAYTADGLVRLAITDTSTFGQLQISTVSSGTPTPLVTCTIGYPTYNVLQKLDWFINYSTTGSTTLYANGVQICTFSGDVTAGSGQTTVDDFEFSSVGNGTNTYWSELIVATVDTRSMNLMTCYPNANGNTMAWSGSYTNVNPTTINDASFISTATSNLIAEFACPAVPSGAFTVPAISQSARVQVGTGGPQNFRFIIRPATGGTDYDNGSDIPGTTNFVDYYNIWQTNPATSSAWSTSDVGTGFNFGEKSRP